MCIPCGESGESSEIVPVSTTEVDGGSASAVPEISRRNFVRGVFVGGASTALGVLAQGVWQEVNNHRPLWNRKGQQVLLPGSPSLAVVWLAPRGTGHIERGPRDEVTRALGRIATTTEGLYYLNVRFVQDNSPPDATLTDEHGARPVYSDRIIRAIGKQCATATGSDMALVIVGPPSDTESQGIAGTAFVDEHPPVAVVRGSMLGLGLVAHELGHLLTPEGGQPGLGHAWAMKSWHDRVEGGDQQAWGHSLHVASIQDIIAQGYRLEYNKDGEPDPYASRYSVMGASYTFDSAGDSVRPIYSAPELAFLDPTRPVHHVRTPLEGAGRIPISYQRGGRIGVTMEIPKGHALRKITPEADTIFFGPLVRSIGGHLYNPIERIGVFTTWRGGRDSALLNPSVWDGRIEYGKESFEHVIYIDEQLGVLVAAGHQSREAYVRAVPLSTEEAQKLIDAERQRLADKMQSAREEK